LLVVSSCSNFGAVTPLLLLLIMFIRAAPSAGSHSS
jgi:hypothetical protein